MNVFVLTGNYDSVPCTHVLGVYATKELAEGRRDEINKGIGRYDSYSIDEFEVIN